MQFVHRHPASNALQWTWAMNLFSLVFALLLAIGMIIALLILFASEEREPPPPSPAEPGLAVQAPSTSGWSGEAPC